MRGSARLIAITLDLLAAGAAVGVAAVAPPAPADAARPYYHLRVVRVSGSEASPGAAVGCDGFCGRPIVAPTDEAWGTKGQLDALARGLGGTRAQAVSGFVVAPGADGAARFEATVYPGETGVRLRFTGKLPGAPGALHDLTLELLPLDGGEPLAEARVLAAAQRTVAVAAPSPLVGEWVVLAVTVLAPAEAERRIAESESIQLIRDPIEPPRLIERVDPVYPPVAREEQRTGKVIVQAVVDAEGSVRAPVLLKVPEGCEDLAAAVVEAVSRWRYVPATLDGKPVPVYITIVTNFKLE